MFEAGGEGIQDDQACVSFVTKSSILVELMASLGYLEITDILWSQNIAHISPMVRNQHKDFTKTRPQELLKTAKYNDSSWPTVAIYQAQYSLLT